MTTHRALMAAALVGAVGVATATLAPLPAAAETVLKAVKHSALRVLDPIVTTAYITRNHGYMIYDTLFAQNDKFEAKPQMVETWNVSADKLTYSFTLRDGLKWHDGPPVTSEDCIASIKRWAKSDSMGQMLMRFVKDMAAVDQKTFTITLSEPYGLVIDSLAKVSSNVPFMMPKRMADTPHTEQVKEQIGSGPFKFVQAEFQPGVKTVYVKNTDYIPRKEAPSWASGGKVVKVDKVEWVAISDHMTAVNALIAGEIDYIEAPPHDLLPILEKAKGIKMHVHNKFGLQGMLRFNHLHPPFDNPKIREAVAYAINQVDYQKAWIGNPKYYQACPAMYVCETPLASDAGAEGKLKGNLEKARQLLKEAGYDGTPVTLIAPTDVASIAAYPVVSKQALERIGMKVDMQAMDWQTLVGRRAKREPPAQGGWNLFHTNWTAADLLNPVMNAGFNAGGKESGWFGWVDDKPLDALRVAFAKETDPAKQRQIAVDAQKRAYEISAYLPIGEYTQPQAFRDNVTGLLETPTTVLFWNVEKK